MENYQEFLTTSCRQKLLLLVAKDSKDLKFPKPQEIEKMRQEFAMTQTFEKKRTNKKSRTVRNSINEAGNKLSNPL
jgi:hypothetical protein